MKVYVMLWTALRSYLSTRVQACLMTILCVFVCLRVAHRVMNNMPFTLDKGLHNRSSADDARIKPISQHVPGIDPPVETTASDPEARAVPKPAREELRLQASLLLAP